MRHKLAISVVLLLMCPDLLMAALPFEVKIQYGRIWAQKYQLGTRPVFNDDERDAIITTSVDTGTGTIKLSDFQLVNISTHYLAIVAELNEEGKISSRSQAIADIEERISKSYVLKKMAETKARLDSYNAIGEDVTSDVPIIKSKLDNYRGRLKVAN